MTNEMLESCIGKVCNINGSGSCFLKVKVVQIKDNWIQIENKGKTELVNADYVQDIKIME